MTCTTDDKGEALPPVSNEPRWSGPLPLWEVLQMAHDSTEEGAARQIKALRDWLQIDEQTTYREAVGNADNDDEVNGFMRGARWYRDSLRAILTNQSRIARGEG